MMIFLMCSAACGLTLPPALSAPRPPASATTIQPLADKQPRPPLEPLDAAMLTAFRWQLQQQTAEVVATPGFEGMIEELRHYQARANLSEQQEVGFRTMVALGGPIPATFKFIASRTDWGPGALAWWTSKLLGFLVGDLTRTQRKAGDTRTGGVLVERCAVLEQSGCKGTCVHMCKVPTERFFAERWGMPLHMAPNFETCQCQLSFGEAPPALEEDPTLPLG